MTAISPLCRFNPRGQYVTHIHCVGKYNADGATVVCECSCHEPAVAA